MLLLHTPPLCIPAYVKACSTALCSRNCQTLWTLRNPYCRWCASPAVQQALWSWTHSRRHQETTVTIMTAMRTHLGNQTPLTSHSVSSARHSNHKPVNSTCLLDARCWILPNTGTPTTMRLLTSTPCSGTPVSALLQASFRQEVALQGLAFCNTNHNIATLRRAPQDETIHLSSHVNNIYLLLQVCVPAGKKRQSRGRGRKKGAGRQRTKKKLLLRSI